MIREDIIDLSRVPAGLRVELKESGFVDSR